jgi:rare lipoprotein A
MKRWLIVVGLLVVGLLMVGRADDALAARHSPSLLQKILLALTPRPTPQHYVGASKPVATRKTEPPVVKPVLTAQPVQAPQPREAVTPDPIAQIIDKTQPVRDVQPDPASRPVRTTQTAKMAKPARAAQPANTAQPEQAAQPVQVAQPAAAARVNPWPVQAEPPIEIAQPIPAAQPELASKPVQTAKAIKKADFAKPKQPIKPSQFEVAAVGKAEPVHAEPPIEVTQSILVVQPEPVSKPVETTQTVQPMQVAILGVPNLKAALPAETAAPLETPRPADEPRVPAARPEPKSACNGGQRVVSAYYWEGRHTASGQPFNPHGMTAAHRTLPFGTRLNVTNPRTGKTVNVLINDRGPYVRGVSLDLSLGAAQAIGLQGTGSVCIL